MKRLAVRIVCIAVLLMGGGCTSIFRIDGPYKGKVVDAETREPLEGVVVLGVWSKVYPNVAGTTSEFYDSVELLTDKNGEFKIPGKGLLLFSFLDEMDVIIFKSGYSQFGFGPWSDFKTRTGGKFVKWDGDKAVFLLRKMSYEERQKRILGTPGIGKSREVKLFEEIQKERKELGKNTL